MKTYIGIDPGKSGALAIIECDGQVHVFPFNSVNYETALGHYRHDAVVCCVEKVSAMPGQGVVSMFNFGHNLGFIEGLLCANHIPYQMVPPQTWKKEFSLTMLWLF